MKSIAAGFACESVHIDCWVEILNRTHSLHKASRHAPHKH